MIVVVVAIAMMVAVAVTFVVSAREKIVKNDDVGNAGGILAGDGGESCMHMWLSSL